MSTPPNSKESTGPKNICTFAHFRLSFSSCLSYTWRSALHQHQRPLLLAPNQIVYWRDQVKAKRNLLFEWRRRTIIKCIAFIVLTARVVMTGRITCIYIFLRLYLPSALFNDALLEGVCELCLQFIVFLSLFKVLVNLLLGSFVCFLFKFWRDDSKTLSCAYWREKGGGLVDRVRRVDRAHLFSLSQVEVVLDWSPHICCLFSYRNARLPECLVSFSLFDVVWKYHNSYVQNKNL